MFPMLNLLGKCILTFKNTTFGKLPKYRPTLPSVYNLKARRGFGTLEIVIIIAVLLTIALIFRKTLINYANNLIAAVFDESIVNDMGDYQIGD